MEVFAQKHELMILSVADDRISLAERKTCLCGRGDIFNSRRHWRLQGDCLSHSNDEQEHLPLSSVSLKKRKTFLLGFIARVFWAMYSNVVKVRTGLH